MYTIYVHETLNYLLFTAIVFIQVIKIKIYACRYVAASYFHIANVYTYSCIISRVNYQPRYVAIAIYIRIYVCVCIYVAIYI